MHNEGAAGQFSLCRYGRELLQQTRQSDFVKAIAETFLTRILVLGIGLVTSVVVTRMLGPERRGAYAVAMAIGALGVQFGNLGLHGANTYNVAKNPALLPNIVANTFLVSFVMGGIGALVGWIVLTGVPHLVPIQGMLLALALAWIPVGLAALLFQNILLGLQAVRDYNKIELAAKLSAIVLIFILIGVHIVSVEAIFAAGLLAVMFGCFWAIWAVSKHLTGKPRVSGALFFDSLTYGIKIYLASLFMYLVLKVDLLLVAHFLGEKKTGWYSVAVAMADWIYVLPSVIGTILFPKLASLPSLSEKWQHTKNTAYSVGLVMGGVVVIAIAFADPAIRMLFGDEFRPSVLPFIYLMPGVLFLSVGSVYAAFVGAIGQPLAFPLGTALIAAVNVILNIIFLEPFGILFAAVSSSLSYVLFFLLGFLICQSYAKGGISQ